MNEFPKLVSFLYLLEVYLWLLATYKSPKRNNPPGTRNAPTSTPPWLKMEAAAGGHSGVAVATQQKEHS